MRACLLATAFAVACGAPAAPRSPTATPERAIHTPLPPSPLVKGTFPVPPQQRVPWTAPAGALGDAASALFAHGLADPRGGTYRAIELAMGSVWSGSDDPLATRGWVLPTPHDGKTWAVAWNGMVYPVLSAGAPADVRADLTALLAKERAARAEYAKENPGSTFYRFDTTAERYGASHETATGTKVMLLLRVGETALAEELWREVALGKGDGAPYNQIVAEWLWGLFDRAVTAHMRGDVALTVATTRPLVALRPLVEAEMTRRKVELAYVGFLEPLDALAQDADRRATTARTPLPGPAALAALAAPARVQLLIEHLDEVSARQFGQPGGVDLSSDPIVAALIAEGNAAVEPLLAVIETDARLTRSVHFHRDFKRSRGLLGVHEAAYVAVAGILETSFFRPGSTGDNLSWHGPDGRRKVADAIRAHWDQWKTVSIEERWYRTLADDTAKPEEWIDAATKITRHTNVRVHPSSTVFQSTTTTSTATPPGMRGESLRGHISPSVSILFEKRIRGAGVEVAGPLALAFGRWEPGAAAAPLRAQTARAIAASKGTPGEQRFGRMIVALVEQRVDNGDKRALDDYAAWIRTTSPTPDGWDDKVVFAPMLAHGTHPSIAAASEAVFADRAPWMPLLELAPTPTSYRRSELIARELLAAPGFRKHALAALADKRVAGTLTMTTPKSAQIAMLGGWSTSTDAENDPLAPPVKAAVPIRVCDHYALRLAPDGVKFQLYWPEAERDKAIAAIAARLKR